MIEIEKKFILTPDQEKQLAEESVFLEEQQISDSYYDNKRYDLTKKDKWLRNRNGVFCLKIPESKDNTLFNQYREIENEDALYTELQIERKNKFADDLALAGYSPFVSLNKIRRKYKNGEFTIDLDIINNEYRLVEVEIIVKDESEKSNATQKILDFARSHNMEITKIKGYIAYYLEKNDPHHFQELINSGVYKF